MRHQKRFLTLAVLVLVLAGSAPAMAGTIESDHAVSAERDIVRDIERDAATDRVRVTDRPTVVDCDRDRAPDRPIDCQRPDRPHDRITDRPILRRCISWLRHHTDLDYGDNLRQWLRACHRLLAAHHEPL